MKIILIVLMLVPNLSFGAPVAASGKAHLMGGGSLVANGKCKAKEVSGVHFIYIKGGADIAVGAQVNYALYNAGSIFHKHRDVPVNISVPKGKSLRLKAAAAGADGCYARVFLP